MARARRMRDASKRSLLPSRMMWVLFLLAIPCSSGGASQNHDIATLPGETHPYASVQHPQDLVRYLEQNQNDENDGDDSANNFEKGAERTFLSMFYNSPSTWTARQWGVFAGMLTLLNVSFFCWCLVCVIPRCCGSKAPLVYAAMV